jgi:hypothetical protein
MLLLLIHEHLHCRKHRSPNRKPSLEVTSMHAHTDLVALLLPILFPALLIIL